MKEYTDFYYNGISSMEMGLVNVSVSGGLFDESFIASRKINEVKVRGNDKPYFMGIEKEPLSFDLEFAFVDPFDKELISEVAMWLDQDYYHELYFIDNSDRRFFCILESDSSLIHNGFGQGYVKIKMRCDSPYSYSQEYLTKEIDFTINELSGTDYTFLNMGHVTLKPEIWIKKIGNGDVSILNKANKIDFEFKGLNDGELIFVDNEREHIESNIENMYRYDSFNDNYLELERGRNILNVKGNCKIQLRYRFKTIQG
jgi:phage-related protein